MAHVAEITTLPVLDRLTNKKGSTKTNWVGSLLKDKCQALERPWPENSKE